MNWGNSTKFRLEGTLISPRLCSKPSNEKLISLEEALFYYQISEYILDKTTRIKGYLKKTN